MLRLATHMPGPVSGTMPESVDTPSMTGLHAQAPRRYLHRVKRWVQSWLT